MAGSSELSGAAALAETADTASGAGRVLSAETGGFGAGFGDAFGVVRSPRVFNESVEEFASAVDYTDAVIEVPRPSAAGEGVVVAPIWNQRRGNPFLEIDRAAQELEAVRVFLLALRQQGATDPRRHNNPPGLLGDPDIDIETIEAASQSLVVLRSLISQPEPDLQIVLLLWRMVVAVLAAIKRFIKWAALTAGSLFQKFVKTTFGESFTKAFGTTLGTSAAGGIVWEIVQHGPRGLQTVEIIIKAALAARGIHL
jgi:hypothetical protein